MLEPMFDFSQIEGRIDGFVFDKNSRMRQALHYVGITFMNNARINASFTDRTGNLRSSIGYAVLLNGDVIDEEYEGGNVNSEEGISQAKKVVRELAMEFDEGYVLIGIAGMEYAASVESKGYDVITGSTPMADELLTYFKKELRLL